MEKWELPSCYAGYSPDGDWLLLSRHRESDTVSESNWEVALRKIATLGVLGFPTDGEERDEYGRIDPRSTGWSYVFRASHPLVGWVEYLLIREDAPAELIKLGHEIDEKLQAYPILDENHHSELEFNQIYDWWAGESLSCRIQLCAEAGDSIFAARRINDIPEATFDRIRDTWT